MTDVSFSVKPREFLAMIGLSGSGKSTLLRCINRLIEPTEGQIIRNGEDITAASQDEMLRIRRKGWKYRNIYLRNYSYTVITNVLAGRLGYVNPAMSLMNHFQKSDPDMAMKQLDRVSMADQASKREDEL